MRMAGNPIQHTREWAETIRGGWVFLGRLGVFFSLIFHSLLFFSKERDSPTSLPSASGWQRPISLPSASGWQMAKRWGYWAVTAPSFIGPHPLLCHLPTDGKDSLPSAGRWQRGGLTGRYSTGPYPPLCHLLADGKDYLPSTSRWQRIG